jgi:S1-C subfamily serine protease
MKTSIGRVVRVLAGGSLAMALITFGLPPRQTREEYLGERTVSVTNLANTSGGSGTIIQSSHLGSDILTNRHVCGVVEKGGLVNTDSKSYFVVSYKESGAHDLCLVHIAENLHLNTPIAKTDPKMYAKATVIGHPHLLPTLITHGYFSAPRRVQVMVGKEDCDEADLNDPDTMLMCMFLGFKPLIKEYDSAVVSALIQPGSSGSAVYNEANEISALVFAGSGDLGFALVVPLDYIKLFLNREVPVTVSRYPSES